MKSAVKRIGVLTSGGDAPGMNAAIRSVVRASMHMGIECLGIRRGFNGLITGDITSMDFVQTSGLIGRGGTVLYTARSEEFKTDEGRKKAANTCKLFGLEGIVGIGGDGTYRGLLEFSNQEGVAVVGVPGTIDNDIACTEYTIGYDTACNTALEAIDRLKDTMQSHERCSVVEVMGRHAGHLALYVGVACGATAVLIPEKEIDFERDVVEPIRAARLAGRTHFMVIVAEGVGSSYDVAAKIKEYTGPGPPRDCSWPCPARRLALCPRPDGGNLHGLQRSGTAGPGQDQPGGCHAEGHLCGLRHQRGVGHEEGY